MIDTLIIICLTLFALIGIIALLDLAEIRKVKPERRSNLLFRILIVEVATVCIGGFATVISKNVSNDKNIYIYEMTTSTQKGTFRNIIALSIEKGIVKNGRILYVDKQSPKDTIKPKDYVVKISRNDTIKLGYNISIQRPDTSANKFIIKFENKEFDNFESIKYINNVFGTKISEI